jgi:uncharacterized protein (TIGR03083 family)
MTLTRMTLTRMTLTPHDQGAQMDKQQVWPTIHAERRALIDDLRSVDEAAWSTPSLCAGWTVKDVLVHMTTTAGMTPPKFVVKVASAGFSLTKMQANDIAAHRADTGAEGLQRYEAMLAATSHPPGPLDTWLGEMIVHAEDIRRPLGITHEYPAEAATRVAASYAGSNLVIGAKNRIRGLRFAATDTDWSTGQGPEISGPIVSLVLAMTGRKSALAELTGDGVTALAARD